VATASGCGGPSLTPKKAFWLEVRKGVAGGLLWGGIHGAVVGALNATPLWLGVQFALWVLAVWLPITTSVGVVRGIRRAGEVRAAARTLAEQRNAADSR
jgi:hypothetical protein